MSIEFWFTLATFMALVAMAGIVLAVVVLRSAGVWKSVNARKRLRHFSHIVRRTLGMQYGFPCDHCHYYSDGKWRSRERKFLCDDCAEEL